MGLFRHDEPADPLTGGEDGVFRVVREDGTEVLYEPDDFDEIWMTGDENEMRRHVKLGWLLLDESVIYREGTRASWIDTMLRREAGRVLPAGDDPGYEPGYDDQSYVLGYLKDGHQGRPVAQ